LKILLVEGGANNFENPTIVNPAVYLSHLAPDSKSALVCLPFLTCRLWLIGWRSFTSQRLPSTSMVERPSCRWVAFLGEDRVLTS
jgi:hypothetical protein